MNKHVFLLSILLCFFSLQSKATVVYVDSAHVGGTQNGTSWTTAFSNFQSGINAANAGDSVWVAKGTYQPAINTSFSMKEGVKILGGFLNGNNSVIQRDWLNNTTILQLDSNSVNIKSVITNDSNNLTSASLIDGFTITKGNAILGRGMYNYYASPTVSNCTFSNNRIVSTGIDLFYVGAGMGNVYSSPKVVNCAFYNNRSEQASSPEGHGGGMGNFRANPIIDSCFFIENHADGSGGAISTFLSRPFIKNCYFANNSAKYAGAIEMEDSSIVLNSIFMGNTAFGGAAINGLSVIIKNCFFLKNSSQNDLGAVSCVGESVIINSVFAKNLTPTGGALSIRSSASANVINCTFFKNENFNIVNDGDYLKVVNTIFWGEDGHNIRNHGMLPVDTINISSGLESNGDNYPQFIDTANNNFRLRTGSFCINAGNNDAYIEEGGNLQNDIDLGGSPRLHGARIDIGAYESMEGPNNINSIGTITNRITINPNPTKEAIHININDNKLLHTKAILMDAYGRIVHVVMIENKSQLLSLAGFSSGIYILKMENGVAMKIVKE